MQGLRTVLVGGADGPARALIGRLRGAAADVAVVADGLEAMRHLGLLEPELIIVEHPLPGELDGFDTCRELRASTDALIVIVASEPSPHDEIVALAVGADQYVLADTPVELVTARIRSMVRRARGSVVRDQVRVAGGGAAHGPGARVRSRRDLAIVGGSGPDEPEDRLVDGDLEIDLLARTVRVAGQPVDLTRIEFDLLVTLAHNPRRVVTRDQLMESAWDSTFDGSHVLDTHLSRLRCKIAGLGGERVAHAVRGVGFRLRA
jgi:DNA-binding response OmpR family regulator